MEYKVIKSIDPEYPKKIRERLGSDFNRGLYYNGPQEFLDRFTMAVICSDESGGTTLLETNQLLFTIREYEINYIGGWHSIIETEVFRLSLFKKYTTLTCFSAKGLGVETFDSFLRDRFFPPLHEFPERDEYFDRAKKGEVLMLSLSEPNQTRQLRKSIMERNLISCVLGDVVFIPYGPKGSKTYTTAKKVVKLGIPAFTIAHKEADDLHKLGIPGFNRKTVGAFLEEHGVKKATQDKYKSIHVQESKTRIAKQLSFIKESKQTGLTFKKGDKNKR